ncbi:hypothetical protein PPERSA_01445 [Pseudocohnilembus persalinus]|uniref:Uncharacterized protein n=1 Tax=Pseudocohnilembus persalinus TaxID=266149 RepID=A0A0V0QH96_PSEPJ|nr:hypothetical protein PPERSA_01445 [Pseudocohnilembus persalinus]|eukprot:KRX01542.1 hypothetical protein PPERSA_01445 [Pseudocohnilembus persalinus]
MVDTADNKQKSTKLLQTQKQNSLIYNFLVSEGDSYKNCHFANDFTGLPALPILGQYNKGNYEFNHVKGLIALECILDDKEKTVMTENSQQKINFPPEIIEKLFNIQNPIIHNQKKQNNNQNNFKNKKPHQNSQDQETNENNPEFLNKIFKTSEKINFYTIFSFHNDKISLKKQNQYNQYNKKMKNSEKKQLKNINQPKSQCIDKNKEAEENQAQLNEIMDYLNNENISEKEMQKKKEEIQKNYFENNLLELNLVPHPFLFQDMSFFQFQKRKVILQPITVIIPEQLKNQANIFQPQQTENRDLSFQNYRSEYLSCHLGKFMSLCFSPNNCKVLVNQEANYQIFYLIFLDNNDESEEDFQLQQQQTKNNNIKKKQKHSVFLYINFSNKNQLNDLIENQLTQAQNIEQLIQNLKSTQEENSPLISHLQQIFIQQTKNEKKNNENQEK